MDFITYVVVIGIWILLGLWCKSIAEKKNRDGLIGFIVGFILGLIGVLIYAFLPVVDKKKKKK